jgi:hypothetical protein
VVAIATLEQLPELPTSETLERQEIRSVSCPANVAMAWSEEFPSPQSSFNAGTVEAVAPAPLPVGCAGCTSGPGGASQMCITCPDRKRKREPKPVEAEPSKAERPAPQHGTVNMYSYHKCRCDECRAAWAAYSLKYTHRHRQALALAT